MAGINNIGSYGMPDYQFKAAMVSTSGFAAQGTGTAKQHSAKMEEQPKQRDGVTLSDNATKSLNEESQELHEEQEHKEQQQMRKSDQQETKLQQQRMHQSSGHAAMALGSKNKDSKTEDKKNTAEFGAHFGKTEKKEAPSSRGSGITDFKEIMEDLNQAATLGILEGEAKKMKSKQDEKDTMRQLAMFAKESNQPQQGQETFTRAKTGEEIQMEKIRIEDINRVMNRTPEEILSDIPKQFRATAEIMVTGQIDPATSTPKESLVQMKSEPRVESAMMELLPAEGIGEIELAENPDSMPMSMEASL